MKMQTMTTQLDDKRKGTIQQLEGMRLAGVKFDQDAGEKMRNVEDKSTQMNEAQRASMEAINQKTEAVYAEASCQATMTGQQIVTTYASHTAGGVLFDFGGGDTLLLEGVDNLTGLWDDVFGF